jgi:putative flippase GtrA
MRIAGAVVNSAVIGACVSMLAVPLGIAKLYTAACTFTTNFVLRSRVLFRTAAVLDLVGPAS